jgi:hypothetical protein
MNPVETYWCQIAAKALVGRKIEGVRWMSRAEAANVGWSRRAVVLILDDGSLLYPSSDDEGNDAGALFGQDAEGKDIALPVLA